MPRGQKSKNRAREKRRQARAETQGLHDQATTSGGEETTYSSPPDSESAPSSSSAAGIRKEPQGAQGTTSATAGAIRKRSDNPSQATEEIGKTDDPSQAPPSNVRSGKRSLTRPTYQLVQFLLHMYKTKKPIRKVHMLKIIDKKYKNRFLRILKRASESMEVLFGIDVKKDNTAKHSYVLVSKMNLPRNGIVHRGRGFPKTGLLMNILGVIFMKGNCATEEVIWNFLGKMKIYAGKRHFLFGEPKKLITQDLVQLKYLEYRQVPGSNSCLRFLSTAVMPRGQKSKNRAREKRHQARADTQGLHDQATTSGGEETTYSSPPDSESAPSSSSAAGTPKGPQGAQGITSAATGAIRKRSGVGAEGQVQGGENSSQASVAAESSHTDPLNKKVEVLVQQMLYKYKVRELIRRSEMLKAINKRYRAQFPEILRRASELIEMVFGLVLKEVRPSSHSYILVSNLDLSDSESMRGDRGLPKNGLLMPLLGVIYLNGHRLSEEEVWKIMNFLGVYDGRRHFIFGDTRKFLTEDLVREGYLKYRQVPGSDPPRYEFLWGPRALMEANKMKVLEFLAKVNDTVPATFLEHFEESFRQEEESTRARDVATSAGPSASASAQARAASSRSSRP
ncbi:unnamed protein product [Rangifer tarandus platyrhynchus]|uniref:MAGE domain-containing protein n=1 Tax=Rangifer tarandus platyrhynchus TaxID=3082113 RepID=A0ABN9A4Q6_RANTA|nr:unnamed protein product [Rangifer tarandus platyrhynchus]